MGSEGLVALSVLGSSSVNKFEHRSSLEGNFQARCAGPMPSCSGGRSPIKFQELRCGGEDYQRAAFNLLPSRNLSRRLSSNVRAGQRLSSKFCIQYLFEGSPAGRRDLGVITLATADLDQIGGGEKFIQTKPLSEVKGTWKKRSVIMRSAIQEPEVEKKEQSEPKLDPEETTRKMGLEAGLWQIFTSKDNNEDGSKVSKTTQAKDLLTRYGGAYLATSISLSLISFGLCFVLISNGVDVSALLEKVGIHANETGEKVGTFALAYAAHKAASPIRFPPTVALTPVVASWFGKKPAEASKDESSK